MAKARCDRCKHWDTEANYYGKQLGRCTRAHPFWDRSEWIDGEDGTRRELTADAAGDMMFVQDASDYHAILLTMSHFFCAHFEPPT